MAVQMTDAEQEITKAPPVVRVLLCIDGSREADNAFKFYREILHKPDSEVLLAHVSDCVNVRSMNVIAEKFALNEKEINEKIVEIRTKNRDIENKYKQICEDAGLKYRICTLPGECGTGKAVVDCIKENDVKFVILGSRGLGKIRRTILGSVSEYVLHHSDVPVFICPPKTPAAYYDMIADY